MRMSPKNLFYIPVIAFSFFAKDLKCQTAIETCFYSENISSIFNGQFNTLAERSDIIVLLGESHGVSINFDIYLNLIKGLNQRMNFKFIAFERSHLEACLFNKFLTTGDKGYLKWDVAYSNEMVEFFTKLREYNDQLPENNRLSFIGVDAIHSIHAFVAGIQSLMPDKPASNDIKSFLDSIKGLSLPLRIKPQSASEYFRILDDSELFFKNQLLQNNSAYKEYFGDNYYHFDFVLKSKSSYSKPLFRNGAMFNNLNYVLGYLENKSSVVGFFGNNHVINLRSMKKSFATLVAEDDKSKFKDNVYRVLIEYENSKALFQSRIVDVPSIVNEILKKDEQKQLKNFISGLKCKSNFLLPATKISPPLNDIFDYLILVKGGYPVTIVH